jgi:hypothetical protein
MDTLAPDHDRIVERLSHILADPKHGKALRDDLREGLTYVALDAGRREATHARR